MWRFHCLNVDLNGTIDIAASGKPATLATESWTKPLSAAPKQQKKEGDGESHHEHLVYCVRIKRVVERHVGGSQGGQ